jgi:hypothetical protein
MAVFSCEAHNDKGLTVSKGVQINIKGKQQGWSLKCVLGLMELTRQALAANLPGFES